MATHLWEKTKAQRVSFSFPLSERIPPPCTVICLHKNPFDPLWESEILFKANVVDRKFVSIWCKEINIDVDIQWHRSCPVFSKRVPSLWLKKIVFIRLENPLSKRWQAVSRRKRLFGRSYSFLWKFSILSTDVQEKLCIFIWWCVE